MFIFLSILIGLLGFLVWFLFETPQVIGVNSYKIVEVGKNKIVLDCQVNIRNNNPYSLSCKKLDVLFKYQNKSLIQSILVSPTNLNASGETILPMRCSIYFDPSSGDLEALITKDEFAVEKEIKGTFTFLNLSYKSVAPVIIKPWSFIQSNLREFIQNLDFSINELEFKKISLEQTKIGAIISFKNFLPCPLVINKTELWISKASSNSDILCAWHQESSKTLIPLQRTHIPVEWQFNNSVAGKWALSQITNGYIETYISGEVWLSFMEKEIQIPINQNIKIYPLSQKIEIINK
jgi:LEA14-like dessication related protein